jgi:methylthioribose-1-phosphate isomerase
VSLVSEGLVNHLQWEAGTFRFLDQTRLPGAVEFFATRDYREVCAAIRRLAIRGAPAIGVAAAYALCLAAHQVETDDPEEFHRHLEDARREIAAARPTAVNLFWALDRMMGTVATVSSVAEVRSRLEREAVALHREDISMCRTLSRLGQELLPETGGVMTYCNTGGLATGGYGTALGVIHSAWQAGKRIEVYVNETRPLFQGARLTAWELKEAGIPLVLITDNMAARIMAQGVVRCVIVGADRIARNGDTANKIGTYGLAVLARHHRVPFYVAAPTSTIDPQIAAGEDIPIEYRAVREVTHPLGTPAAPPGLGRDGPFRVENPAFDVTPAELITAIITERGVLRPPYEDSIPAAL